MIEKNGGDDGARTRLYRFRAVRPGCISFDINKSGIDDSTLFYLVSAAGYHVVITAAFFNVNRGVASRRVASTAHTRGEQAR